MIGKLLAPVASGLVLLGCSLAGSKAAADDSLQSRPIAQSAVWVNSDSRPAVQLVDHRHYRRYHRGYGGYVEVGVPAYSYSYYPYNYTYTYDYYPRYRYYSYPRSYYYEPNYYYPTYGGARFYYRW